MGIFLYGAGGQKGPCHKPQESTTWDHLEESTHLRDSGWYRAGRSPGGCSVG